MLPVERGNVLRGGEARESQDAAVGARERLPVGQVGTYTMAATGGHLEVLQWALDNKCPSESRDIACAVAAEGGHLEVLKWLRKNCWSWDCNT